MFNKTATGRAHKGTRVRHRGVTYRHDGRRVYRESDGSFVGWLPWQAGDVRRGIDALLEGSAHRRRRGIKRRQFGRILPWNRR